MKIEHFAIQVADPVAMADWYVKNLGFSLARSGAAPEHMRFIKDSSGSVMMELYNNPKVAVPDYANMDPLLVHIAFVSENLSTDRNRLVAAGASVASDLAKTPAGDEIVMLRDPWKVCVQLVKRATPMLR